MRRLRRNLKKFAARTIIGRAGERRSSEGWLMKTPNSPLCGAPNLFISKHAGDVIGQLHGFDRLLLQGTLPPLYQPEIMRQYLWEVQVLHKDFKGYALDLTAEMRTAIEGSVRAAGRPVQYLNSTRLSKEEVARHLAAEQRIESGLICALSCLETGRAYEAHPNRQTRKLELRLRPKRCVHLYVYLLHAVLGFMYIRFQTWFPFLVQIYLNGREWLARQMTAAGLGFTRERNCFPWVEDVAQAQGLMDRQQRTHWPTLCNELVARFNPVAAQVRAPLGLDYYWTVAESEYACDVLFKDRARLQAIYPHLIHHGITSFHCPSVLRFLGRSVVGKTTEVHSTKAVRVEGVRLKHWINANSLKMYDKGSVLRVETTINEASGFRVLRTPTGQPKGAKKWRKLRRSTADLPRRAQVSHAATQRYLDALSVVDDRIALEEEAAPICRRVRYRKQSYRALNPFAPVDAQLLAAVNDAKFVISGFTNADLRTALYGTPRDHALEKKRASKVTRLIRLLRAHRLVTKVSKANRYHLSSKGRRVITALLAARNADLRQLTQMAA
jgi:hypothetical protein